VGVAAFDGCVVGRFGIGGDAQDSVAINNKRLEPKIIGLPSTE
jgi:hypothetical protein